jgi:uridine phosphorylase
MKEKKMSDAVFHLGMTEDDLDGATIAIIPGAPERVKKIADYLESPVFLVTNREFTSYRGYLDGQAVIVCSTGIGGPSVSIAVEELAQLGIRTFIRVGTTGAIQPDINIGDLIMTTGAVRLDGASLHFAPMEFPAVADFDVMAALKRAADEANFPVHTGITASSDTFYPGQERYDTYSQRVVRRFQGSCEEWQSMGVMNYEMESATLFTMCASSGLKAGCISGVIVNRTMAEKPDHAAEKQAEERSIQVTIGAIRHLL